MTLQRFERRILRTITIVYLRFNADFCIQNVIQCNIYICQKTMSTFSTTYVLNTKENEFEK